MGPTARETLISDITWYEQVVGRADYNLIEAKRNLRAAEIDAADARANLDNALGRLNEMDARR